MLQLKHIEIYQFKNYQQFGLDISSGVVGICGLNGKGKTNLLDAIYYCCFTRSYFAPTDMLNTTIGQIGFRLHAKFIKDTKEANVTCIYRGGNKKEFYLNEIQYDKFSKHIGVLPVVMIAPDDVDLVTGGSEGRRKYLDAMLSQMDPQYLQHLITYNKVLFQRNALLKNWYIEQNEEVLQILDKQMILPGKVIYNTRKAFLNELFPLVESFYHQIARDSDNISFQYQSQMHDGDFDKLVTTSRQKDILLQRSNVGIHKDDLSFFLNNQSFKSIASQGQKKSLLFALKLAEYQLIIKHKKSCILLLDDVFEKLDEERIKNLMAWVCTQSKGQVFITDTHRTRLEKSFTDLNIEAQIIELE